MNLLDLQKLGIENGELDISEINEFTGKSVLLNFVRKATGIESRFEDKLVVPAPDVSGMTEGTWICSLEIVHGLYRATPIRKIDASFFMELKRSQKDEIISSLWENHKEELLPELKELKELYAQTLEGDIERAVEEATRSLNQTIDSLKEEKAELERTLQTYGYIAGKVSERMPETSSGEFIPDKGIALGSDINVKRVSPDMITSPFFTKNRYFAHVSRDLKTLVIQPHDYGTAICVNGFLILSGLGTIVSYSGETELSSEYVPGKGLVIHL